MPKSSKPSEHIVEIDQSVITAPDFPRSVEWWQRFLPVWFSQTTVVGDA